MSRFEDKVALVTGGASGIGLATAERFVKEGAKVTIADISPKGAETAAGLGADYVQLDVSDAAAWGAAVDGITARHGGLDLAYLNAGIMTLPATERGIKRVDVAALPLENYRRVMAVNVDGVVFGIRAVLPALQARGGGAIVATASLAGLLAYPPDAIYSGTKHFVIGLVRSLARPLAKHDITINAVCPGGVETNILGPPQVSQRIREGGFELMDPAQIADGVIRAIEDGETGQAYMCQAGRDHERYAFTRVPGIE